LAPDNILGTKVSEYNARMRGYYANLKTANDGIKTKTGAAGNRTMFDANSGDAVAKAKFWKSTSGKISGL